MIPKQTVYHWLYRLLKNPRARLMIVLACLGVFILVFPLAYETAGPPAGALVTVMVLIASFLMGTRGGILIWASTVLIFSIEVSVKTGNGLQPALDNWPGILATLLLTLVMAPFRGFIVQLWSQHEAHVTVNEERLKKINDCFLSFDIEPDKNIRRLTRVTGEVLGAAYALYHRLGKDGSFTTVDFWHTEEGAIPWHDPHCRLCLDAVARDSDDLIVIEGLARSQYVQNNPEILRLGLSTYAGKTVRVGRETAGILTVVFKSDRTLTTAEREIIGIVASAVAIEEKRLRSERDLRESEQSYIDLFNSSTDAVFILDAGLRFIIANDGAPRMFGYADHGGTIEALLAENQPIDSVLLAAEMRRVFETGDPVSYELQGRRKSGDAFPLLLVCTKGKYFGKDVIIATMRDLSEQKRMQEQLLQSQKMESLGTLTGGIAHDFNNLLAMILGSAEMLQRGLPADSALRKYADRIVESSARGASISRQLLIFARPDLAEFRPVELSGLLTELGLMLSHFLHKTISVSISLDASHHAINGDAGQIHQAILNLAINADDAMKNGGTLTIRTFDCDEGWMRRKFGCAGDNVFVGISVTDTGMGMDEQTKSKIFDPFFSTKEKGKGTGLGLAIVHGIMKHHGGFIDVESAPGCGTTFTLLFPVATQEAHTWLPELHVNGGAPQETILLVDDEPMLRDTVHEYLTGLGYGVHAAGNGREALQLFETHRQSIDLVITDLGMPEMSGEDLYRKLHEVDPAMKVIVQSGYLDGTTKEALLSLGIVSVLSKPCRMQDLDAAVRAALKRR
ncbi:MAG: response regulator [Acidobacteriota bacterium]